MPIYEPLIEEQREKFEEFYEAHADNCESKLGIELADLSIFYGANVMSNTEAAMLKALEMVDSGIFKRVLIINTSTKLRRILKLGRQVSPDGRIGELLTKSPVCIVTAHGGELGRSFPEVEVLIRAHNFDAVIINSWEFASKNYHYRDELLFRIRTATEQNELTMLVYSQAAVKNYTPGSAMRGSLGKLGIMAAMITYLPMQEKIEKEEKKIQATEEATERSEQFISRKGNLEGKFIRGKMKRQYKEIAPPVPGKEEILQVLQE